MAARKGSFACLWLCVSSAMGFSIGWTRHARLTTATRLAMLEDDDGDNKGESSQMSRRHLIHKVASTAAAGAVFSVSGAASDAAVTDETDNFGDNWWTTGGERKDYTPTQTIPIPPTQSNEFPQSRTAPSDEISVKISKNDLRTKGGLGIELGEVEFRTNTRVYVKSVTPGSTAERLGVKKDWVVVNVNGQGAERTNAEGVAIMVSRAVRSQDGGDEITLRFRDPAIFQQTLYDMGTANGQAVTTQVAPEGDTTQRNQDGSVKPGRTVTSQEDQRLSVTQLVPPKMCTRGAQTDDLLEISYIGTVVDTGEVFDGSAVKINGQGIAGRGNDISIFFVLGKQPFGQFPPGWDVGLAGICVGERRRLIIPPALAYGSKGLPRRGIPPDATLQYDVTLIGLNGLSTPQ